MRIITILYIIWFREILRQWRDKLEIIASITIPVIFLFIIGRGIESSIGDSFAFNYLQFMFPGILGMTVMMTAIYQSISLVYDRELGFLREMLIAPIPRWVIILGKVFGISTVAVCQGLLLLGLAPLSGVDLSLELVIQVVPILVLIAISIASLGMAIASRIKKIQSFQSVIPLPIILMTFLAGTIYPIRNLPLDLEILAKINPLTYGVDLLRHLFLERILPQEIVADLTLFSWQFDLGVLVVFSFMMLVFSSLTFREGE